MSNEESAAVRTYKGRDGEPVTADEKIEQLIEFGAAMDKLAVENRSQVVTLEAELAAVREERDRAEDAERERDEWRNIVDDIRDALGVPLNDSAVDYAAKLQRELAVLRKEARWFIERVAAAQITPREAGMNIQARKWLDDHLSATAAERCPSIHQWRHGVTQCSLKAGHSGSHTDYDGQWAAEPAEVKDG